MPRTQQTMNAHSRNAACKRRRTALARRPISDKQCEVPGCDGKALASNEDDLTDCCYEHSLETSGTGDSLPNDGLIDWTAVEIAAQGARQVRLTWVEKDIALGTILARGGSLAEGDRLLGTNCANPGSTNRRLIAALKIAEALTR